VWHSEARRCMAMLTVSGYLRVEESARLLHAIFPNYPVLFPCCPTPPTEEWPLLMKGPTNHLSADAALAISPSEPTNAA